MYIVGIIGFGIVGSAGLKFFIERPQAFRSFLGLPSDAAIRFIVWDQKECLPEDAMLLEAHKVIWQTESQCSLPEFLFYVDRALVSPGVSLLGIDSALRAKTFCELDLFAHCSQGEAIGITGSLGKTTVTKLIYQILARFYALQEGEKRVALGGNVGIGMLDLLRAPLPAAWSVLELSSFQLENSHVFAPSVGVWTNLYPNHLDRHTDMEGYFKAKSHLFERQEAKDNLILGRQLFDKEVAPFTLALLNRTSARLVVAGIEPLDADLIPSIQRTQWSFWALANSQLYKYTIHSGAITHMISVIAVRDLPLCTFAQNWAVIFAALEAAGVDLNWLVQDLKANVAFYQPDDHKHRVEFVREVKGIAFYNDSKSTVKESTIAAAQQLSLTYKRVHVMIGGVGKGVDRRDFAERLRAFSSVASIIAFGKEACSLGTPLCAATVEEALKEVLAIAQTGDAVLFSPGGASFDLFKHYIQRGECFKELVMAL